MASEEKLLYPDEGSLAARRRAAIAIVLGLSSAGVLGALVFAFSWIPGFAELYASVGTKPRFPDELKQARWGPWSLLVALLPATALFWRSRVPRALDFFLFSSFDRQTLDPIGRCTGMLLWHLPKRGPLRDVWNTLEGWARSRRTGCRSADVHSVCC